MIFTLIFCICQYYIIIPGQLDIEKLIVKKDIDKLIVKKKDIGILKKKKLETNEKLEY